MATANRSASVINSSKSPLSLSAPDAVPQQSVSVRTAVGYVRVSTTMQSEDGLSLDAQQEAIKNYCAMHGLRLFKVYKDVESDGKSDRIGLKEALAQNADVFMD